MRLLDLTLDSAAANVALDEALLEACEAGGADDEVLRLWEPTEPLVVIGRGSRLADEVHSAHCRERAIPVVRRSSGGLAIVTGPGCLMYAVVLSYARQPILRSLDAAHRHVLGTLADALGPLVPGVVRCGTSDLAWRDRKFSGNSARCKQTHLLYHGTLLYDFRLELIGQCLAPPWRAPDYRRGRAHLEFVTNLPLSRDTLREAVLSAWRPTGQMPLPKQQLAALLSARYERPQWHTHGATR